MVFKNHLLKMHIVNLFKKYLLLFGGICEYVKYYNCEPFLSLENAEYSYNSLLLWTKLIQNRTLFKFLILRNAQHVWNIE